MEDSKILLTDAIDILTDADRMEDVNTLLTISENLQTMPAENRENTLLSISDIINDCDKIGLFSVGDILLDVIVSLRDVWEMPD